IMSMKKYNDRHFVPLLLHHMLETSLDLWKHNVLIVPTAFSASSTFSNKFYSEFNTTLILTTATDQETLLEHFSKLTSKRCEIISIDGTMVSSLALNFIRRCC
ncbi:unnamed protein product, partial [Rotaria sp. Silwood2]